MSDNNWYHCEDYELFENSLYVSHPIIKHCPEFAHHITRIALNLLRLEHMFMEDNELPGYRKQANTGKGTRILE
jgi:hypothetical protein